jgi:hypothetical protein
MNNETQEMVDDVFSSALGNEAAPIYIDESNPRKIKITNNFRNAWFSKYHNNEKTLERILLLLYNNPFHGTAYGDYLYKMECPINNNGRDGRIVYAFYPYANEMFVFEIADKASLPKRTSNGEKDFPDEWWKNAREFSRKKDQLLRIKHGRRIKSL